MNPIYKFYLSRPTINLLDPNFRVVGKQLDNHGALINGPNYTTTGWIRVTPGATYHILDSGSNNVWINHTAFYRKDKTYISQLNGSSQATIPSNCYWIRMTFATNKWPAGVFISSVNTYSAFVSQASNPIWPSGLAKEFDRESGEQFFRAKLSGKLTYQRGDYVYIMGAPIDRKFGVQIFISYDGGDSWDDYWQGHFYKTDCEIDEDTETIAVTPSPDDEYSDILDGLDKEFNLVQLAPEIVKLQLDKRPVFQLYRSGSAEITNILSGMYWTQECEVKEWNEVQTGGYHFSRLTDYIREFHLTGNGSWKGVIPEVFFKTTANASDAVGSITIGNYTLTLTPLTTTTYAVRIADQHDTQLWYGSKTGMYGTYTMTPYNGQTGTLDVTFLNPYAVFGRILCDVDSIRGYSTFDIPSPDICENPLNYSKVLDFGSIADDLIGIRGDISTSPTEWGQTNNGTYFVKPVYPATSGIGDVFPICPNGWVGVSVWWLYRDDDWLRETEEEGRKAFTLNDAFPLWSVISVLLNEINAGVSFEGTSTYSEFLYAASNSVRNANYRLFITPKSNLVSAEYDQAAQRGNLSLRQVFDMLRDCFRCYWYIDNWKLRIEHIEYFRRGGSYSGTPAVGVDLTMMTAPRTGKPWATAQLKYTFDKPETYSRIEFAWMDDVTAQFNGDPIDIVSNYVSKGVVESKNIQQFTSDIDYILLNPADISKDGFVLLCAEDSGGDWVVPYVNFGENDKYVLQNGYMSFLWLANYYLYDLPAENYEIAGVAGTAIGTMRLKRNQVKFPALHDPNLSKLIKTYVGDGKIVKLSINLSSRGADSTLEYDTE